MGTQEDKDDFVTLSDEFLRNSDAMEDDLREKMEDDLGKFEDGLTLEGLKWNDDNVKATSLAEKLVDPVDQPHQGVVQDKHQPWYGLLCLHCR